MTLQVELSPQTAAKLRERAAASGKDVSAYARDAIEQRLAAEEGNGASSTSPRQGGEEWFARFNEWVAAAHPPRPLLADDSRDAIYGEERD
jgi:plasmid stability protein